MLRENKEVTIKSCVYFNDFQYFIRYKFVSDSISIYRVVIKFQSGV
jgi:hypothetical protein